MYIDHYPFPCSFWCTSHLEHFSSQSGATVATSSILWSTTTYSLLLVYNMSVTSLQPIPIDAGDVFPYWANATRHPKLPVSQNWVIFPASPVTPDSSADARRHLPGICHSGGDVTLNSQHLEHHSSCSNAVKEVLRTLRTKGTYFH